MSDEWITEATNAKPRSGVALPSNSTSLACSSGDFERGLTSASWHDRFIVWGECTPYTDIKPDCYLERQRERRIEFPFSI